MFGVNFSRALPICGMVSTIPRGGSTRKYCGGLDLQTFIFSVGHPSVPNKEDIYNC